MHSTPVKPELQAPWVRALNGAALDAPPLAARALPAPAAQRSPATLSMAVPPEAAAPPVAASPRSVPPRPYTVFMLLAATPTWRALDRDTREALCDDALLQVYNRFAAVRLRYYDASAFHGRCSDVLLWDVTDMAEYQAAVDTLKRHPLAGGHFEVLDVIPSIPDGWREYAWESGRTAA